MDDDELRAAYERLAAAADPPGDARARVTVRIRERRRRRASGYAALAVLVIAGGVASRLVGGDDSREASPPGHGASDNADPGVFTSLPDRVTCPGEDGPARIDYDHSGYDSLDELVTAETADVPLYAVDRAAGLVLALRADGTAYRRVTFTKQGNGWFPDGLETCAAGASSLIRLAVDCSPTTWARLYPVFYDTLSELAGSATYLHDRAAEQLYFVGPVGRFKRTTIYSHYDGSWSASQRGLCK